ncbi:MAG: large conductance mechanosensitive channel protein MscL [Chloroflexi bacterium]|jgi:large conductance mechanosensitive channel|nr:large conductance mechanosensitive channel protein MscL [Chloroflexota bacterium]
MWQDFKEFISRGNVIDLAIGLIIGASFTAIVNSLVDDIFMPIIGVLLGGVNIEGLSFTVGDASINYGEFLMAVISFLLIALVLFFVIRFITAANKELEELGLIEEEQKAAEDAQEPELTTEERLLTDIRDLLQANLANAET